MLDRNRLLVQESHRLEEVARIDPLTGVYNRGAIVTALEQTLAHAVQSRTKVGLILVDIDHFKQINDRHGHDAGDQTLNEFTRRIAGALRDNDRLGRYGGDEFLALVPCSTQNGLRSLAERLRNAVASTPFEVAGSSIAVTGSFGTVLCDGVEGSTRAVIAAADRALYAAKAKGRNCILAG
jgi:diguanylate cyclase (GGDEF)-like protein